MDKLIELKPKDGYLFTQSDDVPDEQRIFTDYVILGKHSKSEDWKEVSIAKAQAFKDAHAVVLTDRTGKPTA